MTHSFLLRFQERCEESPLKAAALGTVTTIRVLREQLDSDPTKPAFRLLPTADIHMGTATNTRIRSEQGDTYYAHGARTFPIPPILGTTTTTALKMKADDQDPQHQELTVLPKCS